MICFCWFLFGLCLYCVFMICGYYGGGGSSYMGFPGGSDREEFTCDAGDLGTLPGLGRYTGDGNGNPLQYSCLEKSMDIKVEL